jgi:predicted transcriptional regulator of viral defense system
MGVKTKVEKLTEHLKHRSFITAAQARSMGISLAELKKWCDQNKIHRLARGYYGLETLSAMPEQVVAMIPQPCAMGGISALHHYGYTNYVIQDVTVIVPNDHQIIRRPGVRTIRQTKPIFKLGLTKVQTDWGPIQITDREKAVVDGLRSSDLDVEEKLRILKRWRRDPKRDRNRFNAYIRVAKIPKEAGGWLMAIEAGE